MKQFDPSVFPEERGEDARPDVGHPQGYGIEADRADIGPVLDSDDEDPDGQLLDFALGFVLTLGDDVIRCDAVHAAVPLGCPAWAWRAFLEGLVASARGKAALEVARSGLGFSGGDEWGEDGSDG